MFESLDGKITIGGVDCLDIDKDFKQITGVKEGLMKKTSSRLTGNGRTRLAKNCFLF
jgi:hypothetical protein